MSSSFNIAATNVASSNIASIPSELEHAEGIALERVKIARTPALISGKPLTAITARTNILTLLRRPLAMPSSGPMRIAIRAQRKILFVDPADVVAIEAQGNYVLVRRTSRSHLLRESISAMEEKLSPHGFVRIHRSVLVNGACVEEIQPWATGEYLLRARDKEYTVTRTYRKNLRLLAQLWIGGASIVVG